ncbi:MAG: hypothetical protein JJU15_15295 [Pararhodobacter sp.]|nr:hypothetical protein [Pararhodobacter sp.]
MREVIQSLLRLAAADAGHYARTRQRNVALYAVAAVAGLTAYVCLVAAGVLLLARWSDPVLAATFAAAAFAALALVVLAVVAVLNRRDRQWLTERRAVYSNAMVTLSGAALGPKGLALVAAAVMAGLVMGKSFGEGPEADGGPESGPDPRPDA